MTRFLLRSVAPAAILLAAGCSAPSTNNEQVDAANATDNAIADNGMAVDENEAAEAAVAIAPPPAAPAGASADDAAPLAQATQIASDIDSAPDVERVPFEGGWAWRRHGQIVRTSSRDGRRISYFRPGESAPFFVQQGEQSFAYSGGHARRAYDRGGHAAPVAPAHRNEAERLADQSRHDRTEAEHAPTAPHRPDEGRDRSNGQDRPDQHDRPGRGREAAPGGTPTTTNATEPSRPDRARDGRNDRRRDRQSDDDDQSNRMGRR